MNTQEESLAYVEGVVDVSVLLPVCFENPLKELATNFLAEVLARKNRAVIPVSSVIGAYHIATRYLGIPKLAVKKVLDGILRTKSPSLYTQVAPELAEDALNYAVAYGIESWDGYLIALTRSLGAKTIYSLDEELSKVKEVSVNAPFPKQKLDEYHERIKDKLKGRTHPRGPSPTLRRTRVMNRGKKNAPKSLTDNEARRSQSSAS